MTSNNDPTSVRTSVVVAVDRAHAFAVFTERFDTWWPRSHYNGPGELAEIGLEPHPGGRWFTRSTDGSMGTFGSVLLWDPPARLILGWQLNAEFNYDPDLVTELEISFTEIQPHRTLVELEHRHLDRYGRPRLGCEAPSAVTTVGPAS